MKLLKILSILLVLSVTALIYIGALVTSNAAGLTVPDWPTTFGDNMFLYPYSKWTGGIFYEHFHRIVASIIGFITLILTFVAFLYEKRKNVKLICYLALALVIFQGVLGGLTVLYKLPTFISVLHGVSAQTFFCLTVLIAFIYNIKSFDFDSKSTDSKAKYFLILIYFQLIIAAIVRHSGSGLAIPDFPTMGGSFFPLIEENWIQKVNAYRHSIGMAEADTFKIYIHLFHRFIALTIFIYSILFLISIKSKITFKPIRNLSSLFFGLVILQIALGIVTVLSGKDPIITSTHVFVGALLLALIFIINCYYYFNKK